MQFAAFKWSRVGVVPLLLALAGCAGEVQSPADGQLSADAQPSADASYIPEGAFDMRMVLMPPPLSPAAVAADLDAVRAMQNARTHERFEKARGDATVTIFRFADVLGSEFNEAAVPKTTQFFGKVNRELGRYISQTKNCWRRPRPYELDPTIRPTDDLLESTGANRIAAPPLAGSDTPCDSGERHVDSYSFSYPSGHTAFGTLAAILLAQMVPEKHIELFERGREYGDSRLVGSVHFPSDIEAGRILATSVVAMMMLNADFRADLAGARAELRSALGLK